VSAHEPTKIATVFPELATPSRERAGPGKADTAPKGSLAPFRGCAWAAGGSKRAGAGSTGS